MFLLPPPLLWSNVRDYAMGYAAGYRMGYKMALNMATAKKTE